MKNILIIWLSTSLMITPCFSQEDDDEIVNLDSIFPIDSYYYQIFSDTCYVPKVEVLSIIHYDGYDRVYLRVRDALGGILRYRLLDSSSIVYSEGTLIDNEVLIDSLIPNQIYLVECLNRCGNWSEVVSIDTRRKPSEDMISVSTEFYNAIVEYLQGSTFVSFDTFLASIENVSIYEKQSFIQRFFYNSAPFSDVLRETLPALPDFSGTDTCLCRSIRATSMAHPGIMNFANKTIESYSQSGSGLPKTGLGRNAAYWYWLNNRGAAKWHQLWTEGFKSNKGVDLDHNISWMSDERVSYQQGWIRITFLCVGGNKIPRECQCEKAIKYWYRYDTRVKAFARIESGTDGSKNSIAKVEDLAIACYWEEDDIPNTFEVLASTFARAASRCDRMLNSSFWTRVADVATNAATLGLTIGAVTGGGGPISIAAITQIGNAVTSYYQSIADLLNTPYYNPSDCDNVNENFDDFEGYSIRNIRPNRPVVLTINSYSKLYAGGRRAWHSYARILSNFYIAAAIDDDAFNGTPRHCCTPRVGVWVLASCDGPRSTEQLKLEVADKFYHFGFNNLPGSNQGNGFTVPGEYGSIWEASDRVECNRVVVNPGGGNIYGIGDRGLMEPFLEDGYTVFVCDVSGRLVRVLNRKMVNPSRFDIIRVMREYNIDSGIYFVRIVSDRNTESFKVFIE
jgi:hypothetical protein